MKIIGKIIKFSSRKTIKVIIRKKKYNNIYKKNFYINKKKLVNFEGSILNLQDKILLYYEKKSKNKNLSFLKKI